MTVGVFKRKKIIFVFYLLLFIILAYIDRFVILNFSKFTKCFVFFLNLDRQKKIFRLIYYFNNTNGSLLYF
ncbi:hypothetical protein A1OE_963 [Candidatus Endolissoclinum faulkneri L2]|uniref:Uncharacterized protein n=1 Tax=Candidatus Endolissoclinum faulkneri L2 TaxID=1193729 RepID=K7YRG7_9PROT|nr:hypothetical protein A1OE_963 [Candidatus Endolissoclinum faulkneri L2]